MVHFFILFISIFSGYVSHHVSGDKPAIESATLILNIDNVRSPDGDVLVFLYNYENQYPDNPYQHYKASKKDLDNRKMTFSITDLEYGRYGIVLMDDENGNEDLDRFLGIPKEGYSFSNGASPRMFRIPGFEAILVDLDEKEKEIGFKMRYTF